MRLIGFSSGAIALGDFRRALGLLTDAEVPAVELSALRESELSPLMASLPSLDLAKFEYVSIHAPSAISDLSESSVVSMLGVAAEGGTPIIVHPDIIRDLRLWKSLGSALCIENMDKRKRMGRTSEELHRLFERLPEATLCFDIGHARQIDPTMSVAATILKEHGGRIRQLHVSDVDTGSRHRPLTLATSLAYEKVASLVPAAAPIILESLIPPSLIRAEIREARRVFEAPWTRLAMVPD